MKILRFHRPKGAGAPSATDPAGSPWSSRLKAAGLILLCFTASFYLFFPADSLKERIEYEAAVRAPVELSIGELALAFPPGLSAKKLTFGAPGRPPESIDSLSLKPIWSSLFGANPGLLFRSELRGGDVSGSARKDGAVRARLRGISFAEPIVQGSDMLAAGTLAQGEFVGVLPPRKGTGSRLELIFEDVALKGLESAGIPKGSLLLGALTLEVAGKANNFRIERLENSGGDLGLGGTGTLMLADTPARSRLNLNITLSPGPGLDKGITELLDLFAKKGRDGSWRIRVTGTLANPSIR